MHPPPLLSALWALSWSSPLTISDAYLYMQVIASVLGDWVATVATFFLTDVQPLLQALLDGLDLGCGCRAQGLRRTAIAIGESFLARLECLVGVAAFGIHYRRSNREERLRAAWQLWADHVGAMVSGPVRPIVSHALAATMAGEVGILG